jgi:hypothetical protein
MLGASDGDRRTPGSLMLSQEMGNGQRKKKKRGAWCSHANGLADEPAEKQLVATSEGGRMKEGVEKYYALLCDGCENLGSKKADWCNAAATAFSQSAESEEATALSQLDNGFVLRLRSWSP